MTPRPTDDQAAGRSCPLHYRYRPEDMAVPASFDCELLYVVGGLYGNRPALDEVLRLFDQETGRKRLVFNGDFHWFDTDPTHFEAINRSVFAFDALRGNVETELADPLAVTGPDAGCGCAYPEWVGQEVVDRSNRIIGRLRATAQQFPADCAALRALPMWLRVDVGGSRVAVLHGDAESLAGWGLAPEHLAEPAHRRRVQGWFERAGVDLFASSHTCAPVLQTWGSAAHPQRQVCAVANNGAAGMPNLAGAQEGLLTRIALRPSSSPARRFGQRLLTPGGELFVEGLGIGYDGPRWAHDFLAQWPEGSDAHASYWQRISQGRAQSLASVCQHDPQGSS